MKTDKYFRYRGPNTEGNPYPQAIVFFAPNCPKVIRLAVTTYLQWRFVLAPLAGLITVLLLLHLLLERF